MSHALVAVVVFLATAAASALFVSRAIRLSWRLGLVDQPSPRRAHPVPVPRGGGGAIFLAFALGVGLTFTLDVPRLSPETERLLLLLAAAAVICGVMLYDDAVGLGPWPKLVWQVGAAALVVGPRLRGPEHGIAIDRFNAPFWGEISLPLAIAVVATLVWVVAMTNTLNWLDGLDGLAGSVSLVACGVLFVHTYFWPRSHPQFTISLLPLALGAAIVGFLPFNWHPARIIMGDAGANFLGFALAFIAIIGGAKIATALLALGLPIVDAAWVILFRIRRGRSPVIADRGHLHHRLLDRGWSPAAIAAYVAGVSALFGFSSLLLPSKGLKLGALVLVGLVLLGTGAFVARQDGDAAARPPAPGPDDRRDPTNGNASVALRRTALGDGASEPGER